MVDSPLGVAVEKILVSRHNVLIVHTRQRQRVRNAADHAAGGSVYPKGFHHLQSDLIARPGFHTEAVGYGTAPCDRAASVALRKDLGFRQQGIRGAGAICVPACNQIGTHLKILLYCLENVTLRQVLGGISAGIAANLHFIGIVTGDDPSAVRPG